MTLNKVFKTLLSLILLVFVFSVNAINSTEPHSPVADAGDNKYALINTTVTLNASNSTDIDGDKLQYQWYIISKPKNSQSSLDNENSITPNLRIDKQGVYEIQLLVSDGLYHSSSTLEINTNNTKPILQKLPTHKVLLT